MKTIFIMMDSLNKHYMNVYNKDTFVKTPNLDKLAKRGVVFNQHFSGSLPCMPARRELMTGRINFLETPWSPIQPWDDCLPVELRNQKGTYSHMVTDHYHYFHSGGEAYHTLFDSYELERGQENDKWHPLVKTPQKPKFKGKDKKPYWVNREFMDLENEEDYSTPRTFKRGIEFLENNYQEDNWHLHLEAFDPHEPFACPQKYLDMYDDTWNDYHFEWPNYAPVVEGEESIKHIQKKYAAVLTMADVWLGKFLDKMDELDAWKDTTVIFTTDHGHLLGEHGLWAKNYMFEYQELVNIPLIMCTPETAFKNIEVNALTQTIDVMPTLMELFDAELVSEVHGKSLLPLLKEPNRTHHDTVIYGYFGKNINIFDGKYSYCRVPEEGSYAYHHTIMPRNIRDFHNRELLQQAEAGVFLKTSKGIPHLKMKVPSYSHHDSDGRNIIFDIENDPMQSKPIIDKELEKKLEEKMCHIMKRCDAPSSEYKRVGLHEA